MPTSTNCLNLSRRQTFRGKEAKGGLLHFSRLWLRLLACVRTRVQVRENETRFQQTERELRMFSPKISARKQCENEDRRRGLRRLKRFSVRVLHVSGIIWRYYSSVLRMNLPFLRTNYDLVIAARLFGLEVMVGRYRSHYVRIMYVRFSGDEPKRNLLGDSHVRNSDNHNKVVPGMFSAQNAHSAPEGTSGGTGRSNDVGMTPVSDTLYVGNIPAHTSEQTVEMVFANLAGAPVKGVKKRNRRKGGGYKRFAHVQFFSEHSAEKAMKRAQGLRLLGTEDLSVQYASTAVNIGGSEQCGAGVGL